VLFFIDEINLIFSRWRKINDADLEDVLTRFEATLEGARLTYFNQYMRTELENYKNEFAKRLLLFTWQTGRSLKVKSLIAGQNLQPKSFGVLVNDLENCSYIAIGNSVKACAKYKVNEFESDKINQQYELIQKELEVKPELKYTGLYCPSQGKSFFGILPPPNYYKWSKELLCPNNKSNVISFQQDGKAQIWTEQALDELDNGLDNLNANVDGLDNSLQLRPTPETLQSNDWRFWTNLDNLSKHPKNPQNEGLVQLWSILPKKADGTVHKTQAYESVFEVKRSDERKIVSDFIDYLEQQFK
jgi:hypothetical protein